MPFSIGAMLGLYPNGLWTTLVPPFKPCATLPPTFPKDFSVDGVVAPKVPSHPDDIDDSPSSSSRGSSPPSTPSPVWFFLNPPATLQALTAEPMADDEESDSDDTVVDSEDESTNPKSFIPHNVRKLSDFFRIVRSSSRSTAKHGVSRLGRGHSLDGRGVRLLTLGGDSTGSPPLQRRISYFGDDADGLENNLPSVKEKDAELVGLRDSLAQREADNSNLRDQVSKLLTAIQEKDGVIVALDKRLKHRECQYRKLLQRWRTVRSLNSPHLPSELDKRSSSKPLDTRTRENYEYEIARLKEKIVECNSRLEALESGALSPGSEGTSPVYPPTESRHLSAEGNRRVCAPGMRSCASE